ncbi:MAG: DUF4258 domain-containing protein [Candidatus Hydrothermarchaeota archaeon]|nr:DUF4258 domain-containing protein [Candidatus Hydrothermarchaeota archaeon]
MQDHFIVMSVNIRRALKNIRTSDHARRMALLRGINLEELAKCMIEFEVIEEYPDDPRGYSCLLLVKVENKVIHVVCAPKGDVLLVISIYEPDVEEWEPNMKTRKRSKK